MSISLAIYSYQYQYQYIQNANANDIVSNSIEAYRRGGKIDFCKFIFMPIINEMSISLPIYSYQCHYIPKDNANANTNVI